MQFSLFKLRAHAAWLLLVLLLVETSPAGTPFRVIHSFPHNNGKDGYEPFGGLVFDDKGNFYGTTVGGGANPSLCSAQGCGVVFEMSPLGGGSWSERLLHSFDSDVDGAF